MAFFRTVSFSEPLPIIEGDGVFLRAPQMADFAEWAALREASRAFLTPWEPTWLNNDLTRGAFRRRLKRYAEDLRAAPLRSRRDARGLRPSAPDAESRR